MDKLLALIAAVFAACTTAPATTETALTIPPIEREFRGVWVASVSNMDWPSRPGLSTDAQKAELIAIFDKVRAMRMNAVILQVRPGGDALYASKLEPWSSYLTGAMGVAPDPYYDPLEFAVTEAHRRGLELHAWFNPYRARHPSAKGEISSTHLSRTRPDLVRTYGTHLWMDPAEPDVQEHSLKVILDVVERYDIDGVHIDDYFYPYEERTAANRIIPFPDDKTWNEYVRNGGKQSRGDWRRANVDAFVERMYAGVKQTKPWVKVGISPFGIWRPGYPAQIQGLDAYATLYADAKKWLNNGWLDYLTPQLYWNIARPAQSYPVLLDWWVGQNTMHRHLWPGNAPYRVRADAQNWPPGEIVDQIALTRANAGATGNVHFSMRSLMSNRGGVADAIQQRAYTTFALPPRTPWLDAAPPAAPAVTYIANERRLTIEEPAGEVPLWYVIHKRVDDEWTTDVIGAVERDHMLSDEALPDALVVIAIDRNGNESRPSTIFIR